MISNRKLLWALLVVIGAGCQSITDEDEMNTPPKAVAEVLIDGKAVDLSKPIPFEGDPVELVLSGKKSEDADGTIAKYMWLRTDVPASVRNGTVDGGPEFEGDPDAKREATVTLGEGSYRFTLFVTDDDGAVGEPASVSFSIEVLAEYVGDPACLDAYEGTSDECEACVCAPAEMKGCLDLMDNCFNNDDATFSELCVAVLECGVANACLGAACYAPDKCMAEIDAAAGYNGGDISKCNDAATMPGDNPCRAITVFSNCINTEMLMTPDRPGCGKLCATM